MESLQKGRGEGPESLEDRSNEVCVFLRSRKEKILPKGLGANLMSPKFSA